MGYRGLLVGVALLGAGCGTEEINRCTSDSDCQDVAYPFCDVNGHYGGAGLCIVKPMDCSVEDCGCTPGNVCATGVLTTCAADGKSEVTTSCALGCAAITDHCASFVPSYGVGVVLTNAAVAGDVTIPPGSTIATDTGVALDGNGTAIAVRNQLVAQAAGPSIQVFYARSFSIEDMTITGSLPVAFVATGTIDVKGKIEAGGHSTIAGPGGVNEGPMVGRYQRTNGTNVTIFSGGGGNGTAAAGTLGGSIGNLSVLQGGGRGGEADAQTPEGGGGGGAIQLSSQTSITIEGGINVGGGGGTNNMSGGAGGTIVLEAGTVSIGGTLAANGGAGCACNGQNSTPAMMDGQYSGAASIAPSCSISSNTLYGGSGGTGTTGPIQGHGLFVGAAANPAGDGGAVGRIVINTSSGMFSSTGSPVLSGVYSSTTLTLQ